MESKLKKVMKEKKCKVNELANASGVTGSYIYKILSGERNPTMIIAKKIADYFGLTIEELFFDCVLDDSSNVRQKGGVTYA